MKEKTSSKNAKVKKTRFKYKVKNQKGRTITGYIDANNEKEVVSYLENEGLKVLRIDRQNSVLNMQIGGTKFKYS